MNVEHQCREKVLDKEGNDTGKVCGKRYQTRPGNPYNLHCTMHQEGTLVQVEEFGGPDFLNVDEDGRTQSKGHVATSGATNQPPQQFTPPPPPTTTVTEAERIATLQQEYTTLTGFGANKAWGIDRLAGEVEIARGKAKIEREMAEAMGTTGTTGTKTVPAPSE